MRARSSDPQTSKEAAKAATLCEQSNYDAILEVLNSEREYGSTTHELEVLTGIQLVSISPCLKPMEKLHLVARTDRTRKWKKACIVWVSWDYATPEEKLSVLKTYPELRCE